MIVPQFWAEGRARHKEPGRQVTVRRFGWSDLSQEDAQQQADARAQEALRRIWAGDKLARREPKVSYNGAEGVPIREEILSTHGDTVITRNIYGAHCLNTPNVLFADIDLPTEPPIMLTLLFDAVLIVICTVYAISQRHFGLFLAGVFVSLLAGYILSGVLSWAYVMLAGGPSRRALRRIQRFVARHPDWQLRVYETPAGYRVLAMHSSFDPASGVVADFFKKLGTDPVYVRMCLRQSCFRARISPKPWRMGMSEHIKPRPGVWPVKEKYLPGRRKWISAYETKASAFASCRYVQTFGSGATHPEAERVRVLHDERCRAHSSLPLA